LWADTHAVAQPENRVQDDVAVVARCPYYAIEKGKGFLGRVMCVFGRFRINHRYVLDCTQSLSPGPHNYVIWTRLTAVFLICSQCNYEDL
jgi:hypothetical protein